MGYAKEIGYAHVELGTGQTAANFPVLDSRGKEAELSGVIRSFHGNYVAGPATQDVKLVYKYTLGGHDFVEELASEDDMGEDFDNFDSRFVSGGKLEIQVTNGNATTDLWFAVRGESEAV